MILRFASRTARLGMMAALALIAGTISPASADYRIVTPDETRIGDSGGVNFNFATSNIYSTARNALLDPTNFGPGGTIGQSVDLATVSEFTAASLTGADAILIPFQTTGAAFSAAEISAISDFLNAGGGLFAFANSVPFDQLYTSLFGVSGGGGFTTERNVGVTSATSPLTSGPFGTIAAGTEIPVGFSNSFSTTSPGTAALAELTSPQYPIALTLSYGKGRVVLFSDEEIFINDDAVVAGVVKGRMPTGTSSNNLTVFLNATAYAVPEPSSIALMGLGLAGVRVFARRRFSRA